MYHKIYELYKNDIHNFIEKYWRNINIKNNNNFLLSYHLCIYLLYKNGSCYDLYNFYRDTKYYKEYYTKYYTRRYEKEIMCGLNYIFMCYINEMVMDKAFVSEFNAEISRNISTGEINDLKLYIKKQMTIFPSGIDNIIVDYLF